MSPRCCCMSRWPSWSACAQSIPPRTAAYGKLATLGEALYLATVADLLIRDTDRRLAGVLLRVSGAEPPPYHPGCRPSAEELARWSDPTGVPLTQTLLGELANASPHTVARFVDRASEAGLIDWRYGRVRILDVLSLAGFAAGEAPRRRPTQIGIRSFVDGGLSGHSGSVSRRRMLGGRPASGR